VFLDRELEGKAEMKLSGTKNEDSEKRKAFLMGDALQCRSVVQHQVTFCDYRLQGLLVHHEGDQFGVRC
jgi:hypothetical protein